jgi:DNA mismatch repair protein MutS2
MIFDETLLEFPAVRELVSRHAISSLGLARIGAMAPTTDRDALFRAIKLVREMLALIREGQEPPLHGLRDVTNHLSVVRREKAILEAQQLLDVKDFLDTALHTRRYFEPLQQAAPGLNALAMPLQPIPDLSRSIEEKIAPNATVRDSASELLSRIRAEMTSVETAIQRDLSRMVRDLTTAGDLQDDFFTMRNDRYVLPVKTSNRGKVPGIIHDSSNTGETVFIEPFAILEMTNKLADLQLREREECYRILMQIANHVRGEMNALLTDLELLGELEFVLAKARFARAYNCAFPTLTDYDKPPILVDAHHPLLYAHNPGGSRPLNLGLDTADRALIISGPNAGGKTTSLKTIGLTALMVQSALPAPLDPRSRMPVFEDVLANIGDEQNILEGQSTFSAHIRRIAQMLRSAGPGSLVLLDELGTATDPEEGGALAVAILENLVARGTLTIVSSHLGALKNWAHNTPQARNASFRLSDADRRPTYRLSLDMVGISEALVVAEQAGLPPEVLERARSLRPEGEGDATALLMTLQKKDAELSAELDEARRLRDEAEARMAELDDMNTRLREEKRTYRNQMMQDKERELTELRAQVERMIAKMPAKEEVLRARAAIEQAQQRAAGERKTEHQESPFDQTVRPLQRGDKVHVRTLREDGEVQQVDAARGMARVAVGKVIANVKMADLERLAPPKPVPPRQKGAAEDDLPRGVFYRRPQFANSVLDLHGNRVEEALNRTDKFMDEALAAGLNGIKVMHGQGSGALRKALHEYLRTNPVVKNYRYATPEEGGGGVTIVQFN